MKPISQKEKQPIDKNKNPIVAHWQEGLEAILNVFSPYLKPGKLIPVKPLEEDDATVFRSALEMVDLSPNLMAAFLPPSIAGSIIPPECAEELQRIDKERPSYKILIGRFDQQPRILCAEISEHARNPGIDIFQSGALLGSYNYASSKDCLKFLTQAIRAHIWEKGKWEPDNYKKYTLNWFEKVLALGKGTVQVAEDFSFFHSPTLIRNDRIVALFTLIYEILNQRILDSDDSFKNEILWIQNIEDKESRRTHGNELAERLILELLNVMRETEIIKFDEFSNVEKERFKKEFSRTVRQINDRIA